MKPPLRSKCKKRRGTSRHTDTYEKSLTTFQDGKSLIMNKDFKNDGNVPCFQLGLSLSTILHGNSRKHNSVGNEFVELPFPGQYGSKRKTPLCHRRLSDTFGM